MFTRIVSGTGKRRALDVQRVQRLVEHAAGGRARGDAAQLDVDRGPHPLVGGDPAEVDVQDFLAEVIVLDFLDQHGFGLPCRRPAARYVRGGAGR